MIRFIALTGALVMGIGSTLFSIPHFIGEPNPSIMLDNKTDDNICRLVSVREQDMGLGRFGHHISKLSNPALATHNNLRLVDFQAKSFRSKKVSFFFCFPQRKQLPREQIVNLRPGPVLRAGATFAGLRW